ncbi:unnamed protein product [Rotaria socialis]|uniref:Uncharacterized protein n=1 Tax=Rotaria socialis TaxID=392032 RepID=A0A820UWL3_9BILA|nr:unnamed protein product [Rotaria socialis]CAF4491145.1 unnamed protein product [Rotaria socialis]
MQSLRIIILIASIIYLAHAAMLKTPMVNNYPQIAVLGCDSNKANLYYDTERQLWIEHLISECVNDEADILEFCQKAYPSFQIGNILRLDTVLRFENWCELLPSVDPNGIPRCKTESQAEELVQPYRCLYKSSKREELTLPNIDCIMNSIIETGECLRSEKWQQLASLRCSNKSMVLSNSLATLDWCGLSEFRGIQFICCPLKDNDANDDYSSLKEDDPIKEQDIVPQQVGTELHRKIIATSMTSHDPDWLQDSLQWNTMSGYFSDDEDLNDQDDVKLSSPRRSHLTVNEHERFTTDKGEFRRKYKEQIDQLKIRWQNRRNDLQILANTNPYQAQQDFVQSDVEFRLTYDTIKRTANEERTRINELHEKNLDSLLDTAKNETNQKLIAAWNENPLQTDKIEDALYNYLHVLLRDRIHLVNRYERLRVVDPSQAKRKRAAIHERLRLIGSQIDDALNKIRRHSEFQSKIPARIDSLLDEYEEVNKAAEKLLNDYITSPTAKSLKDRLSLLGRDEKKIYPSSKTQLNKVDEKVKNNDDDYSTSDEYDDDDGDDDDDDDDDDTTTTTEATNINSDQVDVGDSDWDVNDRNEVQIDDIIDVNEEEPILDNLRPLMPNNVIINRRIQRSSFVIYLPYIFGILLVVCIVLAVFIIRYIIQQRRKYQYGSKYEKQYAFKEIDSCTPEEKALYALQMNGYENPTYTFFESQTPKC